MKYFLAILVVALFSSTAPAQAKTITEADYLSAFQKAVGNFEKAPVRRRATITKQYTGKSLTSTVTETSTVAGANEQFVKVVQYGEGRYGDKVETTEWRRFGTINVCGDKSGAWHIAKTSCDEYYRVTEGIALDIGIVFNGGLSGAEAISFSKSAFSTAPVVVGGVNFVSYKREVEFLMSLYDDRKLPVYDSTTFLIDEKGAIASIETESGLIEKRLVIRRVSTTFTENPADAKIVAPIKLPAVTPATPAKKSTPKRKP